MDKVQALTQNGLHEDVFLRKVLCLAAAVWLVWEYMITCRDEYLYIWRGSMSRVKVLYMFARYFPLAVQWVNAYIVFVPLSRVPVPRHECMGWFLFLTISASVLLAAVDGLIMLRVMQEMLIAIYTSRPLHRLPFGETCNILETPREAAYIMAGVVVTQTILLLLTVAKKKVAFGESLVVHLVVRDGAWVFVLIVSLWVTIIPYSLFTQVAKPHIMLVWPITLLSIAICRVIINMQKIPVDMRANRHSNPGSTDMDIEFTSYIEMFENSQISTASTHPSRTRGSTS
ncbi:hypothetical protein BDZ97DRAFT_1119698 [Flammula alnicola]|nr:hypothetical protein BDZ97DRAFT_1119698 [Flammula alnicola]